MKYTLLAYSESLGAPTGRRVVVKVAALAAGGLDLGAHGVVAFRIAVNA